jgi:hypothetical protein
MANNKTIAFAPIEKEVIFLKAINELINAMVNYEVMDFAGSSVVFKSMTHQKYFNIILVDFLSRSDKRVIGEEQSYLEAITAICKTPNFNENGSSNNLALATKGFVEWLEQEIQVETWLPTVNTNLFLLIKRVEFIKICGNISKHNFSRLSITANDLLGILARNQVTIELKDALLILNDFYEKFHFDVLSNHASTICEFLNNIRWGIHEYLKPEFGRSIVYEGGSPPSYRYIYPKDVTNAFAKNCYWDLMNDVLGTPYVPRFQVPDWIKAGLKDIYALPT